MTHLAPLSLSELTDQHLIWLDKATKLEQYGDDLKDLLERVVAGELVIWEIRGNENIQGLVGTKLVDRKKWRELWIEILVGTGLLREALEVHEVLVGLARQAHAERIAGMAVRPGLARLYEKVLGVKPGAVLFREELKNG